MTAAKDKPVVVYDGECNFCIAQIERIRGFDKNNQFEYLPRQDPNAEARFPVLRSIDFNKGMRLIVPGEKTGNSNIDTVGTAGGGGTAGHTASGDTAEEHNYAGADAVYQIARRLPGINMIAWLYCVPGINQIAKAVYAWVAANRTKLSRLSCTSGSCDIHK